jgi:hypothetical protein
MGTVEVDEVYSKVTHVIRESPSAGVARKRFQVPGMVEEPPYAISTKT